jgi:hypothetical protein
MGGGSVTVLLGFLVAAFVLGLASPMRGGGRWPLALLCALTTAALMTHSFA